MTGHDREVNDPRWRERGSCAQTDPEVFFPRPGQNVTAARRICAGCPVRVDCLADALNTGDVHFGVRAGFTARERRRLRRELRDQAEPTDTPAVTDTPADAAHHTTAATVPTDWEQAA